MQKTSPATTDPRHGKGHDPSGMWEEVDLQRRGRKFGIKELPPRRVRGIGTDVDGVVERYCVWDESRG